MFRYFFRKSLIVILLLLICTASFTSAGEKYSPKWSKIGILPNSRSVDDYNWCGDSSIIYFHITSEMYDDFRGGIMLYDVKTVKRRWISKDSNTGVGFCNADGSVVYWYSKNGLMAYDVKTSRARRTGIDVTKFKVSLHPFSNNNTILVAGVEMDKTADLLTNLQGWRILKVPFDISRSQTCNDGKIILSKEGDYFSFYRKISKGKCRLAIYDTNYNLQRYIDDLPSRPFIRELITSGGYYFLERRKNKESRLIKRIDIKTGKTTSYPVQENTQGFDINSKGELIYWVSTHKGPNIWFANKLGDASFLLEYEGSSPRFSTTGKYLYFHEKGVVVLERK